MNSPAENELSFRHASAAAPKSAQQQTPGTDLTIADDQEGGAWALDDAANEAGGLGTGLVDEPMQDPDRGTAEPPAATPVPPQSQGGAVPQPVVSMQEVDDGIKAFRVRL